MKNNYLLFFFSFMFFSASGQTERAVVSFEPHELNLFSFLTENGETRHRAAGMEMIPLTDAAPFIACSITWESDTWGDDSFFQIIFWNGKRSSETVKISPDPHAEVLGKKRISHLYFTEKNMTQFRLDWEASTPIENVKVHFFSPGKTNASSSQTLHSLNFSNSRLACPCPQPGYEGRDDWCPAGNCPPDATPVPTSVSHLIVHHSAGSNTSSDWAATVRAIWDFHVNVNGWDDIGYNWLIDPDGILYEGRGDGLLGAHFCGTNGGTMGVCVMGDFTDITPTPDAYARLEDLLSWKICDIGAAPLGSSSHPSSSLNLMHISGHRDGCSTACPGDSFYPTFDDIRAGVAEAIENDCNDIVIAAPTELDAEAVSFTSIELTWLDNAINETGYTIERSVSFNTNFEEIATVPANSTAYSDTEVFSSTGYFYRVKADTSDFSSLYSNEAFAATAFSAIGNENLNDGSVQVFPNPTSQKITLSIENQWVGKISASIFDALGRQVSPILFAQKTKSELRLEMDIGHLPPGFYFYEVKGGETRLGSGKLVVE